jgi:hypothetical protein
MAKKTIAFAAGLAVVCAAYLTLCALLQLNLLEHSPYDSYTLQAMTWREGRVSLAQSYPWLEIAQYRGREYVSFPPFPTLPMLLLSFFFDANTPSRIVSFAALLFAFACGYKIARRHGARPGFSAFSAVFFVLGCNAAEFALYGGVWNLAQVMGLALTALSFYLAEDRRGAAQYLSLIAIACAVGCRPFQALYVPALLFIVGRNVSSAAKNRRAFWLAMLKRVLLPALIAAAYGAYNLVRFDNPLEFGHNYLPEFAQQSQHGQFSIAYMAQNLQNIVRLPWFEDGLLFFPTAYGFAFYLVNPLFPLYALTFVAALVKKKLTAADWIIFLTLIAHFSILLTHKSMGGVQFGTRYLCDLVPAMFFCYTARRGGSRSERALTCLLMLFGIAFNVYGAWRFHILLGA